MSLLQNLDSSMLKDTITVFNPFYTASDRDMPPEYRGRHTPTVIRSCYFGHKSKRNFTENGTQVVDLFNAYIDMENSGFSKQNIGENAWRIAPLNKQEDLFFCFQKGMLLIEGEHEIFSGSRLKLDIPALEKQGFKIYTVNMVSPALDFGRILFYHIGG